MTRKRFIGLRREAVRRMWEKESADGKKVNYNNLDRMSSPKFGYIIPTGSLKGSKLYSYEQAWECLKPLRDIVGM